MDTLHTFHQALYLGGEDFLGGEDYIYINLQSYKLRIWHSQSSHKERLIFYKIRLPQKQFKISTTAPAATCEYRRCLYQFMIRSNLLPLNAEVLKLLCRPLCKTPSVTTGAFGLFLLWSLTKCESDEILTVPLFCPCLVFYKELHKIHSSF